MVSTSFADIFKENSLKNSLLPIVVPPDVQAELFAAAAENSDAVVKIDLVNQTLTTPSGRKVEFPILQPGAGVLRRNSSVAAGPFPFHRIPTQIGSTKFPARVRGT